MLETVSRRTWGAATAKFNNGRGNGYVGIDASELVGTQIHHTAGPHDGDIASILRAIQAFHMGTRGWSDIAYNYLVDLQGTVWEGRGLLRQGGAGGNRTIAGIRRVGWWDARYISVCFIGNYENIAPSLVQMEAVRRLRCEYILEAAPQATAVIPHSEIKATACPGRNLRPKLPELSVECQLAPEPAPFRLPNWPQMLHDLRETVC